MLFFEYILLEDGLKTLCLSAQYQASSGHYIGNSIVLDGSATIQITEPIAVAPQSRPTSCYKVYLFFLMHTTIKDGVEVLFLSAQYQASSGQNYRTFYSYRKGALVK
jgi:hypothetical protein